MGRDPICLPRSRRHLKQGPGEQRLRPGELTGGGGARPRRVLSVPVVLWLGLPEPGSRLRGLRASAVGPATPELPGAPAALRPARPRLRSRLRCGLSAAAERATATSPGPLPSPPPPPFVFAARPRAMGGLPPGPPPAASAGAAAERGTLRGGKEGGEKDRKLTRRSFISIYFLAVVIIFALKK